MKWLGLEIVENAGVPQDEVWLVAPKTGPLDQRSEAQRATRIINVLQTPPRKAK